MATTIRLVDGGELNLEDSKVKLEAYGVWVDEDETDGTVRILPWHRVLEVVVPKRSGHVW